MRLKFLISCSSCDMTMAAQKTLMQETVLNHLRENPTHMVLVSAEVV